MTYDIEKIRQDFPILSLKVRGKPLVYLDNAATTQKPRQVIEGLERYYREANANIHRAVHLLSERATAGYEKAREQVRAFLNARSFEEIVFVRGATEGINLIAQTCGQRFVREGDEILITAMEHHSNIVPWQLLCERTGAKLKVVPMSDQGELDLEAYEKLLSGQVKLVAAVAISNALGTVNPIRQMIAQAHARGIPFLVDAAQAAPHMGCDVQAMDCDFLVFSGHKVYGPTGIGVLYGKREWLEKLPPYQGGGDMIRSVTFDKTEYNDLPYRFEAGTPDISGAIGLGIALEYLQALGLERVAEHESRLLSRATEQVAAIPGVKIIGTAREKASVLSFTVEGVHPHDLGTLLDRRGIAIRTGHHCAQPVMDRLGIAATARASFGLYNTLDEATALGEAVKWAVEVFR